MRRWRGRGLGVPPDFKRADRALRAAGVSQEDAGGYSYAQRIHYRRIIEKAGGNPDIALLPDDTESRLAWGFVQRFGDRLRYVALRNEWMVWTGARWRADQTDIVHRFAAEYCSELAAGMEEARKASRVASARTIAAVERLARTHQRIALIPDDFDRDPFLLNTPAGTVDLKTGRQRPHQQEDYLSKCASVAPAPPGADCPLWTAALERWTGGDAGLAAFYQRLAGYCLTGDTAEQAFFFAHGPGANGKSVFTGAIQGILGDYAVSVPSEAFLTSYGDRHLTELAHLRGARLALAGELPDGRRWNTSRLQQLSGGDTIAARVMRGDLFEFRSQAKLIFVGNAKPEIRTVNEAIRRRIRLLPFDHKIPAAERDRRLPDKLRAEWPAIFRWMIDGCLAWRSEDLKPPPAVRTATEDYLDHASGLTTWIEDACERDTEARTPRTTLYENWSRWAADNGERALSARSFYQQLHDQGFIGRKSRGERVIEGLRLRDLAS